MSGLDSATCAAQLDRASAFGLIRCDGPRFSIHPLLRTFYGVTGSVYHTAREAVLVRYVEVSLGLPASSGLRFVNSTAVAWVDEHELE